MTEIFFSYSSKDRDRVGIAHKVLTDRGFDVFWDLQVPAGADWDRWIKAQLEQSSCVVVFWTGNAAASDNVRHEVSIARKQGKLLQVLLEPMDEEHLPMGMLAGQAARLMDWSGNTADREWTKLVTALEEKATPQWLRQKVNEFEVALKAGRQRIAEADSKVRTLDEAYAREVAAQGDLRRERDRLKEERDRLKTKLEALKKSAEVLQAGVMTLRSDRDVVHSELMAARQRIVEADAKIRALEDAHAGGGAARGDFRRQVFPREPSFAGTKTGKNWDDKVGQTVVLPETVFRDWCLLFISLASFLSVIIYLAAIADKAFGHPYIGANLHLIAATGCFLSFIMLLFYKIIQRDELYNLSLRGCFIIFIMSFLVPVSFSVIIIYCQPLVGWQQSLYIIPVMFAVWQMHFAVTCASEFIKSI